MVSTRIRSSSLATVSTDGSVTVKIESTPAPGEQYAPTRTTLRGSRIAAAGFENLARSAGESD
jgi:hypothetical protein